MRRRIKTLRLCSLVLGFAAKLPVPWFVLRRLRAHWPRVYLAFRYGSVNLNTAEHWDMAWAKHGEDGYRASGELREVRDRVIDLVPQGAVVLDIGCGVGELLLELKREKACQCIGVDISPVAIVRVRELGLEGRVASLPEIPFGSDEFDVVICTETLEHVSDDSRSIAAMARVLRPGGTMMISVPEEAFDDEDMHVRRFTAERLRKKLSRFLRVERIDVVRANNNRTLLAIATKDGSRS